MIKEVTEIPKPNCKPKGDKPAGYYQELIFNDIKEAFTYKISKFELVGYDARPDYIAQVAKAEAYNVCRELIYLPAKKYTRNKLSKEFDVAFIRSVLPTRYSPNSIIRVHGVTLKDGIKHIYCEIDFKEARAFKKKFLENAREKTLAAIERVDKDLRRF